MQTGTLEAGLATRQNYDISTRPHSSVFGSHTDIILPTPGDRLGPQAFLVEQSPDSVAGAHFHTVAQFQVVVRGSGRLGAHDVRPISVHYANPYTGYGPIEAGPEGISYVTLRPRGDPNKAFFMPDRKDEMKPGPRLNIVAGMEWGEQRIGAPGSDVLLEPRPDGIAAWLVRIPAHGSAPAPRHANGGGQFRLVFNGQMKADKAILGRFGCAFLSAAESEEDILAGPLGASVVVLQPSRKQ